MTPQQMRLIRPLTRQHPAAQARRSPGDSSEGWPLVLKFACVWLREYGEVFAEVVEEGPDQRGRLGVTNNSSLASSELSSRSALMRRCATTACSLCRRC